MCMHSTGKRRGPDGGRGRTADDEGRGSNTSAVHMQDEMVAMRPQV
jgi:hypothetical protein